MPIITADIQVLNEIISKLVGIENRLNIDDEGEKEIFEFLSEADWRITKAIQLIDKHNQDSK